MRAEQQLHTLLTSGVTIIQKKETGVTTSRVLVQDRICKI
jgi:hypothetical protein